MFLFCVVASTLFFKAKEKVILIWYLVKTEAYHHLQEKELIIQKYLFGGAL